MSSGASVSDSSMRRKHLWISSQQNELLAVLERKTGISQSEHMRRAMDCYREELKREGKL